ncbi:hypothetical protein Vadar_032963 [Vaccinium darrowii]|uniref:Uncharacterized protein n=1 Tax=Vaccinium darrowii TaxID=229202 RepID=A0ACB7X658_9ERIC|nr:hypothetical protein Vadar_032963 [Vaccinium darrowii]
MKMMANANVSFGFLCFLLSIVVCTSSRYTTTVVAGEKRNLPRTWCVAPNKKTSNVTDAQLKSATDYYCLQPEVDCSIIRAPNPCSFPDTIQSHASVVFNLYYKAHGETRPYCPADVGFLILNDPSNPNPIVAFHDLLPARRSPSLLSLSLSPSGSHSSPRCCTLGCIKDNVRNGRCQRA